jgi:hypothetical protein
MEPTQSESIEKLKTAALPKAGQKPRGAGGKFVNEETKTFVPRRRQRLRGPDGIFKARNESREDEEKKAALPRTRDILRGADGKFEVQHDSLEDEEKNVDTDRGRKHHVEIEEDSGQVSKENVQMESTESASIAKAKTTALPNRSIIFRDVKGRPKLLVEKPDNTNTPGKVRDTNNIGIRHVKIEEDNEKPEGKSAMTRKNAEDYAVTMDMAELRKRFNFKETVGEAMKRYQRIYLHLRKDMEQRKLLGELDIDNKSHLEMLNSLLPQVESEFDLPGSSRTLEPYYLRALFLNVAILIKEDEKDI